jgi:hypothetical protein
MSKKNEPTLEIRGTDDDIVGEILAYAGLYEEFPDADFDDVDRYYVLNLVMDLCSDYEENETDTDAPGGCDGYYKFYSDDPDGLAKKLNEELRFYADPNA